MFVVITSVPFINIVFIYVIIFLAGDKVSDVEVFIGSLLLRFLQVSQKKQEEIHKEHQESHINLQHISCYSYWSTAEPSREVIKSIRKVMDKASGRSLYIVTLLIICQSSLITTGTHFFPLPITQVLCCNAMTKLPIQLFSSCY